MTALAELWADQALPLSLQLGALVLAAGALTLLLRRAAPRVRYAIWLLVVVRAAIPLALVSPIGLMPSPEPLPLPPPAPACEDPPAETPVAGLATTVPPAPSVEAEAPPALSAAPSIQAVLAGGWLFGVGVLGTLVLLRHRRLRREIARGHQPPREVERFVERQRERLGLGEPVAVRVLRGGGPAGPAVVGVLKPVLVLPAWMASAWREPILGPLVVHELVHLRRRDGWVNLLVTVVQVLYFFHPLVWLATWLLVKERERVCDDRVVAAYEGRPEPYVRALCRYALASAGNRPWPALSALAASRADLVRRIERLAEPGYRAPRRRFLLGGLAVAAVVAALVGLLGAQENGGAEASAPELDLPADLPRLEAYIRDRPDDLSARFVALEAYLMRGDGQNRDRIRTHALRLATADEELDTLVVQLLSWAAEGDEWLAERILSTWTARHEEAGGDLGPLRAATSFAVVHRPDLAADLAQRGEELAPTEAFWPWRRGEIVLARGPDGSRSGDAEALAGAAAEHLQRAAGLATGVDRLQVLAAAALAELAAGRTGEARRLAALELAEADTVAGTWYHGNAVHEAHIVLGLAALAGGEVERAEEHLRRSAEAPPSPQLRSFGPDVSLADALLDLGRVDAVLDYFNACRRFWESGHERLDDWASRLRRGERPDFGASRRLYRL